MVQVQQLGEDRFTRIDYSQYESKAVRNGR